MLNDGVIAYLSKPVEMQAFLRVLDRFLESVS
jgi:response regulator of citrate/malate metabolism